MLNTLSQCKELGVIAVYGGFIGETLSSKKRQNLWPVIIENGIKTIIDVRKDSKLTDRLCRYCRKYGLEYFHFPLEGSGNPQKDSALFSRLCYLIDKGSFYMECANGKHRIFIALCVYWVLYLVKRGIKPPYINGFFRASDYEVEKLISRYPLFHDFYTQNTIWNTLAPYMSNKEFSERFWFFNDVCFFEPLSEGYDMECDAEYFHYIIIDGMRRYTDANWRYRDLDLFMFRVRLCMNYMSIYQIKYNDWLDEFIDNWGWFSVAYELERDKAMEHREDMYAHYKNLNDKPYYIQKYHTLARLDNDCKKLLKEINDRNNHQLVDNYAPNNNTGLKNLSYVVFSHGKESGPLGNKIKRLMAVAEKFGLKTKSIDYRGCATADERASLLNDYLNKLDIPLNQVVLVGSSMGGYVSMVVANEQPVAGLFLMAPALWMTAEEYTIQSYTPKPPHIEITHGLLDDTVPCENSIRFAREHEGTILHLVPDDHRLKASHDFLAYQFQRFLEDISKQEM